jgi:hypothetical protein
VAGGTAEVGEADNVAVAAGVIDGDCRKGASVVG